MPQATVRLPRELQVKYDSRTSWALGVEEPSAKRSRRTAETLKHVSETSKLKGKSSAAKHKQSKIINKQRDSKATLPEQTSVV